jgi:hypothetical protein
MPLITGADPTTESLILNSTEPLGQTALVTFAFNVTWSLYCPATEATVVVVGALTVTLNEFVVVEPSILVPLTVTVVVPTGKSEPEGGSLVTRPQLPLKVGGG